MTDDDRGFTRFPLHTRRRVGGAITAAAAAVLLTACHTHLGSSSTPSNHAVHIDTAGGSPVGHTTTPARSAGGVGGDVRGGASSGQLRLVQEPQDNYRAIDQAISSATKTLDMTMYELADDTAQTDLIAAHDRGIAIRIILDKAYHGGEVNADAHRQLTAAGIAVHWAPSGQTFHQKTLVIDEAAAWIGTGNLTARYYPTIRDAWIRDTNPTQVTAIARTFNADWASPNHSGNAVGAPGLVWSPGAQEQIVADIAAAHTSVDFTSEELADTQVIAALAAAAKRGVLCGS